MLISTVARVDRRGWRYVLATHCGLKTKHQEDITERDEFESAPFVFSLDEASGDDDWVGNMLLDFFSDLDAPPSAYLTATVRQIANNMPRRLPPLELVDIPIAVTVNASCNGTTLHAERIYRMLRTFTSMHNGWHVPVRVSDGAVADTPIECAFVLRPMEVDLLAGWVTPNAVRALTEMTAGADEVPVGSIAMIGHLEDDSADDAQRAQILGSASERLLCASGVPEEKRAKLDKISLQACFTNRHQ